MMSSEQIDIEVSRLRTAGIFLGILSFCVGPAWLIYAHPASFFARVPPGSFVEFVLWADVPLFGIAAARMSPMLFRSGALVSIGPKGIFDRRLSTDWIPWTAIQDVGRIEIKRRRAIAIMLAPHMVPSLPLLERRRKAALRDILGPSGFLLWGVDLKGGFKALDAAVARIIDQHLSPPASEPVAR